MHSLSLNLVFRVFVWRRRKNINFETLGLESLYFMNNMGTLIPFYFAYFTAAVLVLLLHFLARFNSIVDRLYHKLFWKYLITLYFESYSIICVSCLISIKYHFSFDGFGNILQTSMCIIFFIGAIGLPVLTLIHLYKNFIKLKDPIV